MLRGLILSLVLSSCSGGQRIEPEKGGDSGSGSSGIFDGTKNGQAVFSSDSKGSGSHEVLVVEVLNTSKYSYLRVKEGDSEPYWIASMKADFQNGQRLMYEGGLLKTDFKSVEHDRVFDKVYLVSKIRLLDGGEAELFKKDDETPKTISNNFKKPEQADIVDLADIINNPTKFEGEMVKVYGEVVKANPNIMNRNWLHIKDGTADDFDFVLTTQSSVPIGHAMVFDGIISLNRDFGAGYTYKIIMENAEPVQ
jgi:hypothetical protein